MSNINTIKFTPYQFFGMIVMFIGLIATAIGPYIALKTEINHLNVKLVELDLKLTTYFNQRENEHKVFNKRLDILEENYSKLHDYNTVETAEKAFNSKK